MALLTNLYGSSLVEAIPHGAVSLGIIVFVVLAGRYEHSRAVDGVPPVDDFGGAHVVHSAVFVDPLPAVVNQGFGDGVQTVVHLLGLFGSFV